MSTRPTVASLDKKLDVITERLSTHIELVKEHIKRTEQLPIQVAVLQESESRRFRQFGYLWTALGSLLAGLVLFWITA